MKNTIVLLYHDILRDNKDLHIYDVALDNFRQQMNLMKVLMSRSSATSIGAYEMLNEFNVSLSFDDGYKIWAQEGLEILNKHNLKAHFFICINNINDGSIQKSHIRTLNDNGMFIGSHSVTHRFMNKLTDVEIYKELKESKDILEDIIGKSVEYFSIPRGICTDSVIRIAKEVGYKYVFSSQVGVNNGSDYLLKRISVKRDTTLDKFKKILNGEGIDKLANEQGLKDRAKAILGIDLYNKLRRFVVPRAQKKR